MSTPDQILSTTISYMLPAFSYIKLFYISMAMELISYILTLLIPPPEVLA